MKVSDLYKKLLAIVSSELGKHDYSRKGARFYLSKNSNWGVIEFQKSNKSDADRIVFTVNIGVCSKALLDFFSESGATAPSIEDCQFRQRLGFLLSSKDDRWWSLTAETDVEFIGLEISTAIVNFAVPEILENICDAALVKRWLSDDSPGLTDIQRLMNLSVLLKLSGDNARLSEVIQELAEKSAGKSVELVATRHIKRLS